MATDLSSTILLPDGMTAPVRPDIHAQISNGSRIPRVGVANLEEGKLILEKELRSANHQGKADPATEAVQRRLADLVHRSATLSADVQDRLVVVQDRQTIRKLRLAETKRLLCDFNLRLAAYGLPAAQSADTELRKRVCSARVLLAAYGHSLHHRLLIYKTLAPEVKILSLAILSAGRPDIVVLVPENGIPEGIWFTLKEGSKYSFKFTFQVNNDIVSSLIYKTKVWKSGFEVDRTEEMLGTFCPQFGPYNHMTTPSCEFAPGLYSARAKFLDHVFDSRYLEINYNFEIPEEWPLEEKNKEENIGSSSTIIPAVRILSLAILSPGRPDIVLLVPDNGNPEGIWFTLKEGCKYKLKFTFQVYNAIVSRLSYTNKVWKSFFKGSYSGFKVGPLRTTEMLGTFSPQLEAYNHVMAEEITPSGKYSRGSYSARAKFLDHDYRRYFEINYSFDIREEWPAV